MGVSCEFRVEGDRSVAICAGSFDLAEAVEAFRTVFAQADVHGLSKIFVDFRAVRGNLTTTQRFEFGAAVAALYTSRKPARSLRVALLLDASVIDPTRFGETVVRNRGMNGKVTDDEAEANAFLDLDPR